MSDDLLRRDGENEYEYHKRLIYGKIIDKTLSYYSYEELSEYVYGKRFSTDVARRLMYGSCRTMQLIDSLQEENVLSIGEAELTQSLTQLKNELQKERYKLQTEKNEYARWLREEARDDLFEEKVIEAIRSFSQVPTPVKNIPITHGVRDGVLCIADCHFGKEYEIYGLHNEVINAYSPEIFYSRMEQILEETKEIVEKEKFSVIHVYNLGDSVEGFLRNSQIWTLRYGVIDSAILFGNYMGEWLRKLSEFVNVVYAQTDGNHDELRLLDGRKNEHLCESAGKIIRNCISLKNENNPNFTCIENRTGLIFDSVAGMNLLGIHGEVKDMRDAIKEYANIYGEEISYLIAGHKHHSQYDNCGVRCGCIGVGSIAGSDDFSMSLRKTADATASFIIFEQGKGRTDEHTFVLN